MVAAAAVAAVAWIAVATGGDDDPSPPERPHHLVDVPLSSVTRIDVADPSSGRSARLTVEAGRLVFDGDAVTREELATLQDALFPLLAIRTFDEARQEFGLTTPRLEATIVTRDRTIRVRIGAANFDDTGVYVDVDGQLALVLTTVADVLGDLVAATPSH